MHRKIILTSDGSHTIRDDHFHEHYHSVHGAICESAHVFIEQGLKKIKKNDIKIFEVGFGTGLNVYLSLLYGMDHNITIRYTSIDLYPLQESLFRQLNYPDFYFLPGNNYFEQIHTGKWNITNIINPSFTLKKINTDLLTYVFDEKYDIVYFDAFSPVTQPELWTEEVFRKFKSALMLKGILVTYSASGNVRRNLQSAGFYVEKIQGPKNKRHMLRAIKIS